MSDNGHTVYQILAEPLTLQAVVLEQFQKLNELTNTNKIGEK